MDAELMVPKPETESELLKLIVEYRHMLRTIFGEAINIKYIELIKVDLQTKIFEQNKDNRDPEEDPMTGSQFREQQHDGDQVIDNLVPLKLESGQPTQGLNQGLKGPHGELLSSESFQQSSKLQSSYQDARQSNIRRWFFT